MILEEYLYTIELPTDEYAYIEAYKAIMNRFGPVYSIYRMDDDTNYILFPEGKWIEKMWLCFSDPKLPSTACFRTEEEAIIARLLL